MLGYKKQTSDRTIHNYGLFLLRCNDKQWHKIGTSIKETPINKAFQVLIKALQEPYQITFKDRGGGTSRFQPGTLTDIVPPF